MELPDAFEAHHASLAQIHERLAQILAEVSSHAGSRNDELAARVRFVTRALHWHHHAESSILFPALRRAGRLRSSDVAFLDGLDRDHVAVGDLTGRLRALTSKDSLATEAPRLAADLLAMFTPHASVEEAGLAPEHLRSMLTAVELEAIGAEVEAARLRFLALAARSIAS